MTHWTAFASILVVASSAYAAPAASAEASVPAAIGPAVALHDCMFPADVGALPDPLRPNLCRPGTAELGTTSTADLASPAQGRVPLHGSRVAPDEAFGSCASSPLNDRCPRWTQRYTNAPGVTTACGSDVPSGSDIGATAVFVTGRSCDGNGGYDIATVAYDHATGAQLWVARYGGPAGLHDLGLAVAVAPDGARVFVSGVRDYGAASSGDFVTIAYDAATGAQLWVTKYDGTAAGYDEAAQVAVAPDGERVYVTGTSRGSQDNDVVVVSYIAATGKTDWVTRYDSPNQWQDTSTAIAAVGDRIYVAGSTSGFFADDFLAIAIRDDRGAHQGEILWGTSAGSERREFFTYGGLAVASGRVVLIGAVRDFPAIGPCYDGYETLYETVILDAATGVQQWTALYAGQSEGLNVPSSVAISPDGRTAYVTGWASGPATDCSIVYGTVAYNLENQQPRWVAVESIPGLSKYANALSVSPDGATVFVTGTEYYRRSQGLKGDLHTVAYAAGTGARRWQGRYSDDDPARSADIYVSYLSEITADGSTFLPIGVNTNSTPAQLDADREDYVVLAYEAAS